MWLNKLPDDILAHILSFNTFYGNMRIWIDVEKLDLKGFYKNPAAVHILEKNPAAIHIIEKNLNKINWPVLSRNPAAIPILEANYNKIHLPDLALNPAAIHLLEKNQDKICWKWLSENPSIFICDKREFYTQAHEFFRKI